MIRRFFLKIRPHIIPEMKLFFKKILPAGMILGCIIFLTDGNLIIRDTLWLYLFGVLLCVGGIYIMRIIAYLNYNIIKNKDLVKPDILIDKK